MDHHPSSLVGTPFPASITTMCIKYDQWPTEGEENATGFRHRGAGRDTGFDKRAPGCYEFLGSFWMQDARC